MCGIIGYVGNKKRALEVLINGLYALEYRGYDSSGVAFSSDNQVVIKKASGKVQNLEQLIDFKILSNLGIGHTRWATHGESNVRNAHPHQIGKITLVHNGIIENYGELKTQLVEEGISFVSETDTEVACALINKLLNEGKSMLDILASLPIFLKGSYAFAIIIDNDFDKLYFIKNQSPLIIGVNNEEHYLASDLPAVLKFTDKQIILEDGDYGYITPHDIHLYHAGEIKKPITTKFEGTLATIEKNGYEHFMMKEIMEQKEVFHQSISRFKEVTFAFEHFQSIDIVACGSAYHAGLIGKFLIETYQDIPVYVEIASEYRYKKLFLNKDSLVILVSQSGETADTLAALKKAKEQGAHTLAIVNVIGSSIARAADTVIYTNAGPEIAVATTKGYFSQILIFIMLISEKIENSKLLENLIDELLKINVSKIADTIFQQEHVFFLGRGNDYSLALEGSLKLKEISYIHSEAYAAGELKHGTISLIQEGTPVIGIITDSNLADKTLSNIKEVKTRGAKIILLVAEDIKVEKDLYDYLIVIPVVDAKYQSLLTIIPLQLLSYEIANLRKCDIDKPRNLAKSVTVE